MASDSSYLLNHVDLQSLYYQTNNENGGIIDLGLSLRALQSPTYDHSDNPHHDYNNMVEWNQLHPYNESPDTRVIYPRETADHIVDERNMFKRSKHRSEFVKVNMEGVLIGRKICVIGHSSYLSLATQLEDMFGKQSLCSLRLFESDSEFSLWYKDQDEQWRIVGDVPWKEFVDIVTRIRIMLKDETLFRSMNTMV